MSLKVVKLIRLAVEPSMPVFQILISMFVFQILIPICVLAICECVSLINHGLFLLLTRLVWVFLFYDLLVVFILFISMLSIYMVPNFFK